MKLKRKILSVPVRNADLRRRIFATTLPRQRNAGREVAIRQELIVKGVIRASVAA